MVSDNFSCPVCKNKLFKDDFMIYEHSKQTLFGKFKPPTIKAKYKYCAVCGLMFKNLKEDNKNK